jgi:hypothetical protein
MRRPDRSWSGDVQTVDARAQSHRIATMRVFAAYLNEFELTLRHSFEWPGGGAMP